MIIFSLLSGNMLKAMEREHEIKLTIPNVSENTEFRAWVEQHGISLGKSQHKDHYLFGPKTASKTTPGGLVSHPLTLRVRERPPQPPLVAMKRTLPQEGAVAQSLMREEAESHVESAAAMLAMFALLGYKKEATITKLRHGYRVPVDKALAIGASGEFEVDFDRVEFPRGQRSFIEVELHQKDPGDWQTKTYRFLSLRGVREVCEYPVSYLDMTMNPGVDFGQRKNIAGADAAAGAGEK